jgi:hypothetical protein
MNAIMQECLPVRSGGREWKKKKKGCGDTTKKRVRQLTDTSFFKR